MKFLLVKQNFIFSVYELILSLHTERHKIQPTWLKTPPLNYSRRPKISEYSVLGPSYLTRGLFNGKKRKGQHKSYDARSDFTLYTLQIDLHKIIEKMLW